MLNECCWCCHWCQLSPGVIHNHVQPMCNTYRWINCFIIHSHHYFTFHQLCLSIEKIPPKCSKAFVYVCEWKRSVHSQYHHSSLQCSLSPSTPLHHTYLTLPLKACACDCLNMHLLDPVPSRETTWRHSLPLSRVLLHISIDHSRSLGARAVCCIRVCRNPNCCNCRFWDRVKWRGCYGCIVNELSWLHLVDKQKNKNTSVIFKACNASSS